MQSYEWDYRNRLVSVKERNTSGGAIVKQVNYEYDAFNRLVHREYDADGAGSGAAANQYWVYDEGINAVLQYDGSAAPNLSHRYLWSNQVDEQLADEQVTSLSTGGNTLWGLGDHLGTLRDIADLNESTGVTSVTNHRTYNAFGKLTAETNSAVDLLFGYTGKQLDDATGLQHNLHRWYDSAMGQWICEDPLSFYAGDSNVRRYVGNNALTTLDPSGLRGDELPGRNLLTWRNALLERTEPGVTPLRPLTAGETSLVQHVFGNMVDPSQVVIVFGVWPSGGGVTPGNIIFFPNPRIPDFANTQIDYQSWFIHEMTHVMQAQHGQDNIETAASLLVGNLWVNLRLNYDDVYIFDPNSLGQPFNTFNMEQQARIVQWYFDGHFTGVDRDRAGITLAGFPMVPELPHAEEADLDVWPVFDDFIGLEPPPLIHNHSIDPASDCNG